MIFSHLVHISRTQGGSSNFEYYLKIKNLPCSDQDPVELDKILRYECKIRKEIIFLKKNFLFKLMNQIKSNLPIL